MLIIFDQDLSRHFVASQAVFEFTTRCVDATKAQEKREALPLELDGESDGRAVRLRSEQNLLGWYGHCWSLGTKHQV